MDLNLILLLASLFIVLAAILWLAGNTSTPVRELPIEEEIPRFGPRAVDTANKRASSVQLLAPWMLAPPFPDGTLDQGDRQHIAWAFSGVLAGPPVGPTFDRNKWLAYTWQIRMGPTPQGDFE